MATLGLLASIADARPGRGGSFGSRGERTFSAPPTTNTAPRAAAPIDKSITQPGAPSQAAAKGAQPGGVGAPAAQASRFGGVGALLMGGLFAAGLASIFGVGALASVLGFMLQALLIAGVIWLAWSFMQRRAGATPQPAMARANGSGRSPPPGATSNRASASGGGAGLGSGAARGAAAPSGRATPARPALEPALELTSADFDMFEQRLGEIQTAFGSGSVDALSPLVTPEVLSYFAAELADNERQGLVNEVSSPRLLQGDLSEAWREPGGDYASVAMRYAILDATVEKATGRIVDGSRTQPTEVTEVWTFRRAPGGKPKDWELSAVQQA